MLLLILPEGSVATVAGGVTQEDVDLPVVGVHDDEGRAVLPAFTSESAMARWTGDGARYVALPERAVLGILLDGAFDLLVIDGVDAAGGRIVTPAEAESLLGGSATLHIPPGTQIAYGLPAEPPPPGFLDGVRRGCESEIRVLEAFVYQIGFPGLDEPPHLAIGLRLAPGTDPADMSGVVDTIGRHAAPSEWGYPFVDFSVLDDEMRASLVSFTEPVFRRA